MIQVSFKATSTWGMLVSECGRFAAFVGDNGKVDLYDRGRCVGEFLYINDLLECCDELANSRQLQSV